MRGAGRCQGGGGVVPLPPEEHLSFKTVPEETFQILGGRGFVPTGDPLLLLLPANNLAGVSILG